MKRNLEFRKKTPVITQKRNYSVPYSKRESSCSNAFVASLIDQGFRAISALIIAASPENKLIVMPS